MPAPDQGIAGSDESFISFAFAIMTLVCICVYLPLLFKLIRKLYDFAMKTINSSQTKRRRYDEDEDEDPVKIALGYVTYVPKVILFFAQNPLCLKEGFQLCLAERAMSFFVLLPRFLKFIFRPKIFILWVWFMLLSSAMYASLTFDAHAILGVSTSASTGEIKKAYRKLTKINHPDHNKTDAARDIYFQVRKAYKALVDKDAFEEEQAKEQENQFAVGVALPRFLTSHENDTLVLFGLLFVLFGVPAFLYWKFSGNDGDRLRGHLDTITTYEKRVEGLLDRLGAPTDAKFIEKRRSRRAIFAVMQKLGLAPEGSDETALESFPSYLEFRARCIEPGKHKAAMMNLGFDEEGLGRLKEYFQNNEAEAEEFETVLEGRAFEKVAPHTYKATRFMLEQVIQEVDNAATEIDTMFGGELRATRRLRSLHSDILQALTVLYERDAKVYQTTMNTLAEAPKKSEDLGRELPEELNQLFRKMQTRRLQEMGYGNAKQQRKMMLQQQRMMQSGGMRRSQQQHEEEMEQNRFRQQQAQQGGTDYSNMQ